MVTLLYIFYGKTLCKGMFDNDRCQISSTCASVEPRAGRWPFQGVFRCTGSEYIWKR